MFIEIDVSSTQKIIIGSVYRPAANHPTLTSLEQFNQFIDILANILNNFSDKHTTVYLFGDFNLDVLRYNISKQSSEYINLLFALGYLQLIIKPTRCTHNSASLIDHIVTNSRSELFQTVILTTKISDHFPIILHLSLYPKKNDKLKINYRDFSEENLLRFRTAIKSINWNNLENFETTQDKYDYFLDIFTTIFNINFPLLTKNISKSSQPLNQWMSKGLLISRSHKIELCKASIKYPYEPYLSNYKTYWNLYAKLIPQSKKLYFQSQLIKHQMDAKKTWIILRKAINNKSKKTNSIQQIISNNEVFNCPERIACKFNEFFTNVANDVVSTVHPSNVPILSTPPPANSPQFKFNLNAVTGLEIIEAIKQLKDKTSLDSNYVSTVFLKKVASEIAFPLQIIFQSSLETRTVSSQLKIAKIVPIFKSGDIVCMDNYRPIALLDSFSKILEKIVCNRLTQFLENNKLLSEHQFGFRKEHSTIHPMLLFMNEITAALENKKHSIAIFCDLRKAFDTVNHKTLLKNFKNLGSLILNFSGLKITYLIDNNSFK